MKSIKLFTLIALTAFFAACTNKSTSPQTIVSEKKIVQILVEANIGEVKETYSYTLKHDEKGRITKAVPDHPEIFGFVGFEYGANTLGLNIGESVILTSLLNEDGYIISSEGDAYPFIMEEFSIGHMVYNDKGQLETIGHPDYGVEIGFLWKGDNMVRMESEAEHIDFTYTQLENKNNFGLLLRIDEMNRKLVFPFYSLLGKPTKHLPETIGDDEGNVTFQYKLDDNGYIEEMAMVVYQDGTISSYELGRYKFVYE